MFSLYVSENSFRMKFGPSIIVFSCILAFGVSASVESSAESTRAEAPFLQESASFDSEEFDISDLVQSQNNHLTKAIERFSAHGNFFKSVDALLPMPVSASQNAARRPGTRTSRKRIVRKYVVDERTTTPIPVSPSHVEADDIKEAIISCIISLPKMMASELQILAEFVHVKSISSIKEFVPYVRQAQIALHVMIARRDQAKNVLDLVQQFEGLSKTKKTSFIQQTTAYLDECQEEIRIQQSIKDSFGDLARMLIQNERERVEQVAATERQLISQTLESYEIIENQDSSSDWVEAIFTDDAQSLVNFDIDGDDDYDTVDDFVELPTSLPLPGEATL